MPKNQFIEATHMLNDDISRDVVIKNFVQNQTIFQRNDVINNLSQENDIMNQANKLVGQQRIIGVNNKVSTKLVNNTSNNLACV